MGSTAALVALLIYLRRIKIDFKKAIPFILSVGIVALSAVSISPNTQFSKVLSKLDKPKAELIQSVAEFSKRGVLNETTLKSAIRTFGIKAKDITLESGKDITLESGGEAIQETGELYGQAVAENYVNQELERDVLEGYNAITKDNLLTSEVLGALGGGVGATVGNIGSKSVNNKNYLGYLQYLNKDKDSTIRILDNLVDGGNVTKEQSIQLKQDLDELIPNAKKIPTNIWENLKGSQKLEAVRLLQTKKNLEIKLNEVDPIFQDNIKEQIQNIDNRLKVISNEKPNINQNDNNENVEIPQVQTSKSESATTESEGIKTQTFNEKTPNEKVLNENYSTKTQAIISNIQKGTTTIDEQFNQLQIQKQN
jgi:hypothetical protein